MISRIVNLFWKDSPKNNFKRIISLLNKKKVFYFKIHEILENDKLINTSLLLDRMERYLRIINKSKPAYKLSPIKLFKNKIVYELGCGPLLGWGPIAIFLGAKYYIYNEVAFNNKILHSNDIKNSYFKKIYNECVSNYGKRMTFNEFIKKLRKNTIRETSAVTFKYDLFLSNSVLEHVEKKEISYLLSEKTKKMKRDALFLHAVDFSSHLPGLTEIYSFDRENGNRTLNLLRKSEIIHLLNDSNLSIKVSIDYRLANVEKNIHASWKKFKKNDLEVMTAIFYGKKK